MAANNQSTARRVIPRWRTFREALAADELSLDGSGKTRRIDGTEFIQEKESAWMKNKELPFAIDLVSAATVLGKTAIAENAATFILENSQTVSIPAQKIARNLLGIAQPEPREVPPQSRQQIVQKIKSLKERRIEQPRNAFVWVDLARLYLLLGQNESARQTLKIAQMLAPSERFVMRCTARFLHHVGENDEALDFLRKNTRTPFDPWLIAAEIAASAVAEKNPKFVKAGESMLKAEKSPFHTSELFSALASLDMESGNHRAAKKKFLLSLRRPTDNALAQAVWASKRTALGNINIDVLEAAQASEALAWNDFNQGKWDNVIFHADKWGREEGFSARPLVLSSSIAASLLRRPDLGEEIARTGLVTNPGHPALVNNVAYSLALQGRATDALSFLENANIANLTTADQVCLLATYGMACYRSGSEEEGTRYYEGAIERAKNANEESLRVSATLHMAYERARLGLRDGVIQFKKAYEAAEKLKSTHLPALADILAEDVEQVAGHLGIAVEIRKPKKVLSLAPDQLWLPPKL